MVEVIAMKPPITLVSRLMKSFMQVTSCRRSRSQDLKAFVSLFRGLAADYLINGVLSAFSQAGEVSGIRRLNNVTLSEETLINTKL